MHVRLRGKTRHGKNRVREHGDIFDVRMEREDRYMCKSLVRDYYVWVEKENDEHFEIVNSMTTQSDDTV